MRVTNRYIATNLNKNIQQNLSRVARTQEQLSTGKSMLRPSDKPGNLSPLLTVNSTLSFFEQYDRNLDDGLSYLSLSDGTMQTMGDILNQASQMAVQGANATYTTGDMAALAEQIDKVIDHVLDLGNSSVGKKYIYAGTKNNNPPFKRTGDLITYTGNLNGIFREVLSGADYRIDAPGVTTGTEVIPLVSSTSASARVIQRQLPANLGNSGIFTVTRTGTGFTVTNPTALDGVTPAPGLVDNFTVAGEIITIGVGEQLEGMQIDMAGTAVGDQFKIVVDNQLGVFGRGSETPPGSGVYEVYNPAVPKANAVDEGIFDVLFKLRDRLKSGDKAGTDSSISEIQRATDQLLQRRVGTGSRTRHFEALKEQITDMEVKLKDIQQKLQGADIYKLSINLSQDQVTFEASLASGASIMQVSLLNFLK
ncbi:MAG: flagellar hook-associated protein FlgL [Desulfocucumaceae bacterium]